MSDAPTSPDLTPRWDDLRIVLAIARAGSLSGAAARLALNTSTVARRLDALEERLDLHLFDRTSSGVLPTEAAEALLPAAEQMEQAAADAMRVVEGRETTPEGVVRLTAPPGWASLFIAPALVRLAERHPKLRIELDASVGYADLTRREADIALRVQKPKAGDFIVRAFVETELVPVAIPEIARTAGRVRSLDALRWITWGRDLAHLPDARWIAGLVNESSIVLRTSSIEAQRHAIAAGLGVGMDMRAVLGLSAAKAIRFPRALRTKMPPLPRGTIWLVTHRALRHVPRVAAVWTFLLEEAARLR